MDILSSEKAVLSCLIHPERLDTVMQETGLSRPVAADILRQLHHHGYIKCIDKQGKPMANYDADRLPQVRFTLCAKGFDALEEN
ncbi:MAG: hypothetical protein ACO3GK_00150 [Bacteroidia bacterium]